MWFIHNKLGLTAYAFALDDDIGNVEAGGATHLDISVGGLNGLPNKDPYSPVSQWGVVTTQGSSGQPRSSVIADMTNPKIVRQIAQFDYHDNTPKALVNGPGVPTGTTVQFLQITPDVSQSRLVLTDPLTESSSGATYSFFGPLVFTGTVLGRGQRHDTIVLDSQDAYNTLLKLGSLQNIGVTGEGVDPAKPLTVKNLSRDPGTGAITVQLSGDLDRKLVSQPGGSYTYTFGSPRIGIIRDPGFEWATVQGLDGKFNHGAQLTQNTVDWTFTDSATRPTWFAGIAFDNDSDYTRGNPPAPQGLQVGFVEGDSSVSQTVTLGNGACTLPLVAAQSARNQAPQPLNILVDGKLEGTLKPHGTTYQPFTIPFAPGPGEHTITFQGVEHSASAVLLDAVACKPASPVAPRTVASHPAKVVFLTQPGCTAAPASGKTCCRNSRQNVMSCDSNPLLARRAGVVAAGAFAFLTADFSRPAKRGLGRGPAPSADPKFTFGKA